MTDGPASTAALARSVMGFTGNPAVAAAAVHALLDRDPRFTVSAGGDWSLVEPEAAFRPPLRAVDYAVVDVETSGGLRWRGHGIVEIAIVHVSRGSIAGVWHTLVDPGRRLPPFVTELTGITPAMVRGAPTFEHMAAEVHARLEGRVFVAHNVGFDWGFVASHLERTLGQVPRVRRLCTMHMARRLLHGGRGRSLDAIADRFGIETTDRHRALGDALATARILLRLLDVAELEGITDLDALARHVDSRPVRRGRGVATEVGRT